MGRPKKRGMAIEEMTVTIRHTRFTCLRAGHDSAAYGLDEGKSNYCLERSPSLLSITTLIDE